MSNEKLRLKTEGISTHAYENVAYGIMLLAVALGFFFRLKGLGQWSFTNDEYYLAESVNNILRTGMPEFEVGGYYVRGLLYQYLMVPFKLLGTPAEITFRLVPVVCHILALPPLFQLSRKVCGKIGACLVLVVFSLSLTETELSRFARMYLPFQTLFLWDLLLLYRVVFENNARARVWLYCLSVAGLFIFEGAVFLAVINFIPLITAPFNRKNVWHIIICIAILAGHYIWLSFDFRHFPVSILDSWPSDIPVPAGGGSSIYLPALLLQTLMGKAIWLIGFLILMGPGVWVLLEIGRSREIDLGAKACLALVMVLGICNQFGLLLLVLIGGYLLNLINGRQIRLRCSFLTAGCIVAFGVFWIAYGWSTESWRMVVADVHIDPFTRLLYSKVAGLPELVTRGVDIWVAMFAYPFGISKMIYEWWVVYPLMVTGAVCILAFGIILLLASSRQDREMRFVMGVFLILTSCVGVLSVRWGTRYTFFIFPVLIVLVVATLTKLLPRFSPTRAKSFVSIVGAILALLIFSEDLNPKHLLNIDSANVNFRKVYSTESNRANHYIMRRDYRGVAEVIDREAGPEDIVVSAHQTVDFYSDKITHILFGSKNREFKSYTAEKGRRERWTGAALLYDPEQLFELIDRTSGPVWIVLNVRNPRYDELAVIEKFEGRVFFKATDGILAVIRVV